MLLAPEWYLRSRERILSAMLVLCFFTNGWATRGSFLTAPPGQAWPSFCLSAVACPVRWVPLLVLGIGHRTRLRLFVPLQLAGLLVFFWSNAALHAMLAGSCTPADLAAAEAWLDHLVPPASWLRLLDWRWLGASGVAKLWALLQLAAGFLAPVAYACCQEHRELLRAAPGFCQRRPCAWTACAQWLLAAGMAVAATRELAAVQACAGGQLAKLRECLPVVPLAQ